MEPAQPAQQRMGENMTDQAWSGEPKHTDGLSQR
jgi:hypothetical protein